MSPKSEIEGGENLFSRKDLIFDLIREYIDNFEDIVEDNMMQKVCAELCKRTKKYRKKREYKYRKRKYINGEIILPPDIIFSNSTYEMQDSSNYS